MNEKKKRDFGEPIFHCFVALSIKECIVRLRTIDEFAKVNYLRVNGNDEFHYFMLQYLEQHMVKGRLLGTLNRWAQSDETSIGIFAFDSHLYDRMFSVSLHSDTPTIYDIEAYHNLRNLQLNVPQILALPELKLLDLIRKIFPQA